jgi:hypothetical protein
MPLILKIENEKNYILVDSDYPADFLRGFAGKSIKYVAHMPTLSRDISEIFEGVEISRTEVKDHGTTSYSVLDYLELSKLIEMEKKERVRSIETLEKGKKLAQAYLDALKGLEKTVQQE